MQGFGNSVLCLGLVLLAPSISGQSALSGAHPEAHLRMPSAERSVPVSATDCQPTWLPLFGENPGVAADPGVEGRINDLAVFDDGSGPALYAGGYFTTAGSALARNIARWDGTSWSAVGSGVDGEVEALTVFDDGSGPALYVGGAFLSAGGVAATRIAKWDGTSWSGLASGPSDVVLALIGFDDGSGPALYAGGRFTTAGGVAANRIARWDGASWSPVGSGVSGTVHPSVNALTVFDDGGGPALYVGGSFHEAGGVSAEFIAKWDGTGWFGLGAGLGNAVFAVAAFDDGSGPALFVGGTFEKAGGFQAHAVAKWDGATWSSLGTGLQYSFFGAGSAYALTAFDDGTGSALYACGVFTKAGDVPAEGIAKWDGMNWSALGSGLYGWDAVLAVFDDGSGAALFAGGEFYWAGGEYALRIARWDGASWSALGSGLSGTVGALTVSNDGGGSVLYVGGSLTPVGGVKAWGVGKWDGKTWSMIGGGAQEGGLQSLAVFDDGNGPALFAGTYDGVAKWDGTSWSMSLDGSSIPALEVFDDGSGAALYAAHQFSGYISRWNGTTWSTLASTPNQYVLALKVFDDGSGPALYAAGWFSSAGGVPTNRIAKWDGTSWSPLGSGLGTGSALQGQQVHALAVFDDGDGQQLYAAGTFLSAGGSSVNRVAKWNGLSWSALGDGVDFNVEALAEVDVGSGRMLYAGGAFQSAGGVSAKRIASWDGASWSALESGMANGSVLALAGFDDGGGASLFAGGDFSAGPAGQSFLAKWGGCPPPITSVPGCAGNVATLEALAYSAPLGEVLPLLITGSAATSGVGAVFAGATGFDGAGCGTFVPGIGELLLAFTPPPLQVTSGVLGAGTCTLLPLVPSIPALQGVTVYLQGAALHLPSPSVVEVTNALAVKLGP